MVLRPSRVTIAGRVKFTAQYSLKSKTERLSDLIREGDHMLSADGLMNRILESVTDFCRDVGFNDDVTILVVKCNFDGA